MHRIILLCLFFVVMSSCSTLRFTAGYWEPNVGVIYLDPNNPVPAFEDPGPVNNLISREHPYVEFLFGEKIDYSKITLAQLRFSIIKNDANGFARSKSISIALKDSLRRNKWIYDFDDIVEQFQALGEKVDSNTIFAVAPYICYNGKLRFHANPNFARIDLEKRTIHILENERIHDVGTNTESKPQPEEDPGPSSVLPKDEQTTIPGSDVEIQACSDSTVEKYVQCMLSDAFKKKIKLSDNSRLYKFTHVYDRPLEMRYKSGRFGITETFKTLVSDFQEASKLEAFQRFIKQDSVAILFEGSASPAQIREGEQIYAELDLSYYYKWDKLTNCLAERSAFYNNVLITNADLPALRACKTANYFVGQLDKTINDIEHRVFPVARDIDAGNNDNPADRTVNIYLISKPIQVRR